MSKAILVLDKMPDDCISCPFNEYGNGNCLLFPKNPTAETQRPDWCPLREMPERIPDDPDGQWEYDIGWNECLDEIEGTEAEHERNV